MHDVVIIGAGAAGIACAKEAASSGLKTILIEKKADTFGGICLNAGCIPTKSFINSSKLKTSWQNAHKESREIVERVKGPALKFLRSQGIEIIWGQAKFLDKNTLLVGQKQIKASNIIIATGSLPKVIAKHPKVITSENLITSLDLPEKILIIGAGYIGIEFASLLHGFGKRVIVVEKEENILPNFDSYFSRRLRIILEKKGIKIETGKDINDYDFDDFDVIISAVGRKPNSEGLDFDNAGVLTDPSGWIKTDERMRTNIANIYACGDVNGKKLLAYIAEYQARICINAILGSPVEEDYKAVPECVFSIPSVAKVGILEDEAKSKGVKHTTIRSNFSKFSSSYPYKDEDGFVEILADDHNNIIGAGIISQAAGELISLFAVCIKNNLKINDLEKCLFVHPTLSEIMPLVLK